MCGKGLRTERIRKPSETLTFAGSHTAGVLSLAMAVSIARLVYLSPDEFDHVQSSVATRHLRISEVYEGWYDIGDVRIIGTLRSLTPMLALGLPGHSWIVGPSDHRCLPAAILAQLDVRALAGAGKAPERGRLRHRWSCTCPVRRPPYRCRRWFYAYRGGAPFRGVFGDCRQYLGHVVLI